jgi:AraC-like DNA-binding protein
MPNNFLINTLALVTSILLLIFSFFAISQRKSRKLSSILLSVFLLSNSLFIIDYILPTIQSSLKISLNWFSGIGSTFGYLFGPLIFLFTRSITNKNYKLSQKQSWHFLLFVIAFISEVSRINIPWQAKYGILNLQIFPYLIMCIIVIRNYRNEIKEYFSSVDKINLTWLLYVVVGFFLMWFIDLVNFSLSEFGWNNLFLMNSLTFASIFINFVFALLIFYKALQQPQFLFNISEEVKIHKYESSKLSREEKEEFLKKIEDYFVNEKPFLKPSLTITDISNATNIHSKYISQVINESLNKNFYDFINSYRIKEAMNQLLINGGKEKTILEILYDSGFNSKSAFNTAFKKNTGFTPTEFRHQNITA